MSKVSRIVIGLAAVSLLLAACSNTAKNESPPAAEVQQNADGSTAATDPSATESNAGADHPAAVTGSTVAEAADESAGSGSTAAGTDAAAVDADAEPIASIPEKAIYLYPDKPEGVMLHAGEHKQHFDWLYDTPRMIMPQLQLNDYDGDGENELAAITYVASGTGLSIYELHMVEGIGAEAVQSAPYDDHVFAEDDYLSQLDQALEFKKAMKDGELFGQVTVGGQQYEVSLKDFQKEYGEAAIGNTLGFGAIIQYQAEQGALTFSAAVGLVIDNVAEPQYIGDVQAVVSYKDGKFKLEQFGFTV